MNSIAVEPSMATRVRLLKDQHPYMTHLDIAKLTGFQTKNVVAALKARTPDKPKTRIEARGPISADDVAKKTGMPLSSARLLVR